MTRVCDWHECDNTTDKRVLIKTRIFKIIPWSKVYDLCQEHRKKIQHGDFEWV